MSRPQIIALSIVCCAFGLLALRGPHDYRTAAYVVNIALAIVCFIVAGRDLTAEVGSSATCSPAPTSCR